MPNTGERKAATRQVILLSRDFTGLFAIGLSNEKLLDHLAKLFPGAALLGLEEPFNTYLGHLRQQGKTAVETPGMGPVIVSACPRIRRHVARHFPHHLTRLSTGLAPAKLVLDTLVREHYSSDLAATRLEVLFVSPCLAKARALREHARKNLLPSYPSLRVRIHPARILAWQLRRLPGSQIPKPNFRHHHSGNQDIPSDVLVCHGRRAFRQVLEDNNDSHDKATVILPYWCSHGCSGKPAR